MTANYASEKDSLNQQPGMTFEAAEDIARDPEHSNEEEKQQNRPAKGPKPCLWPPPPRPGEPDNQQQGRANDKVNGSRAFLEGLEKMMDRNSAP